MRLGINASFLGKPHSGIGQVTRGFLEALFASLGEAPELEIILYTKASVDFPIPERVRIRPVASGWPRADIFETFLWERFTLSRAARKDRCEALLSLYQSATVVAGLPHVMLVHDLVPEHFPLYQGNLRKRFYWQSVKRALHAATGLVAVSRATRADLARLLGRNEEDIPVAYPALPADFKKVLGKTDPALLSERFGLEPGYWYAGGGFEVRKNMEGLLRAYALLREQGASVPPLVLSGFIHDESNPLATPIRSLIKELGLEERVTLVGSVSEAELASLYRGARLFVYPSRFEGFGLPVLEALASGTPVLSARNSSLPEVGGEAVEYLAGETPETIAEGLMHLSSDETRLTELGAKGPAQAERFSWASFTDTLLQAVFLSSGTHHED
jgi:glycosyltransferase involved in cell wall biosynthesis